MTDGGPNALNLLIAKPLLRIAIMSAILSLFVVFASAGFIANVILTPIFRQITPIMPEAVALGIFFAIGAILSVIIYLVIFRALRIMTRPNISPLEFGSSSDQLLDDFLSEDRVSASLRLTVRNLDQRINNLSSRSSWIYWTMIVTLLAGVLIIIFAGRLSNLDTTWSMLRSSVTEARRALYDEQQDFYRAVSDDWQIIYSKWLDSHANELKMDAERKVGTWMALQFPSFSEIEFPKLFIQRSNSLNAMDVNLQDAMVKRAASLADTKPEWNWSSTVLRLSVVGLLVFLTQILISLYRYNSRLITFYTSRREALILSKGDINQMAKLISLLFPQSLDFGREPKHPFWEAGELFGRFSSRNSSKKTVDPKSDVQG